MERRKKGKAAHMISAVAETYDIHPQTLRLYEREGLLKPSRSEGNTRLYTQEDLERLEEMQREMQDFIEYVEREFASRSPELNQKIQHALVRVTPPHVTVARPRKPERH